MPLYFFNVYDGTDFLDKDGVDLVDWDEARTMAITSAGELIKDRSKRQVLGEDWRMEVTDETGLVLFRLDFRVMESPALMGSHRHRVGAKPD